MKTITFTSIIICMFGSSWTTTAANKNQEPITIPLDISTQRPILELMLNNKGPYRFIFDTGSSGNVIDEELATNLALDVIGEDPLRVPGSDNKLMSKRVKVLEVAFPGTGISEGAIMNTMAIRKLVSVDGILSPIFFSNYLLTMDYPNSKLILTSAELSKADKDVTDFIQKARVINLDVLIDGNKLEAHLDSGNPGGFDIPFDLKGKLTFKKEPTEAGVINTPVASFKKWKATLDGEIKIGSVIYKNPEVNLVEGFPYVNLGYQLLKDLRTTIDRKNSLIKFEKLASVIGKTEKEDLQSEKNDFTGWYGGHERKIFVENGEMFLQRGNAPKLKLVKIKEDKYEMVFHMPVRNELPNVRFERNSSHKVTGLTFVFKDGREDFFKKDQ